jgi:hypothetical protein
MRKRPDVPLLADVLDENCSAEVSTRLGVAFGHVCRYFAFLHYIFEEYEKASNDFVENTKAIQVMFEQGVAGNAFTEEQVPVLDQAPVLHDLLHLRIETFYLFAKIFLDKIAHFLEFYFGQGRGLSLDSHDQLVKNFAAFSESKGLALTVEFLDLAERLKTDISDYRDYQISHEKSPRTLYSTSYDAEGKTTITQLRLNPTEKDRQARSTPLADLLSAADRYLRVTFEILKSNANKSSAKGEATKAESNRGELASFSS